MCVCSELNALCFCICWADAFEIICDRGKQKMGKKMEGKREIKEKTEQDAQKYFVVAK